ncbi:MAG: DNA-binding response regulator [Hyphomicrobiales bacterium]|nr:MAG: DNA-binding response regulator [Hyphomicrobiales bacterium]
MTMADRILVVDDDPQITSFLERYLVKQGYEVTCVGTGADMLGVLEREEIDLCVLDIGLPDRDGFELTKEVRLRSNMPIVVLSARDETFDRVVGLEFGADDYVTKPFEPRELLARIKSVLRRFQPAAAAQPDDGAPAAAHHKTFTFGDWVLDAEARTVSQRDGGADAGLTSSEFDILYALVTHSGTVFDRDRLLDIARGRSTYSGDRAIDVHIMRLRRKIEPDPANPIHIKTVHGAGYVLAGAVTKG